MYLFDSAFKLIISEEFVGIVDDGGDRGGRFGSGREPGSDRIATYAFSEAGGPFLQLRSIWKRGRCGPQV